MDFTRDTTIDPSALGDTVLQAVLDLDHDLSGAYSGLNAALRAAAFRINTSEKGAASGVCELDSSSKVPVARLPKIDAGKLPAGTTVPVGTMALWPAETAPANWAECDGTKLNSVTYADLLAVIGYAYGGSSAEGEFALPDLRGQFVRGWDHGAGVDPDAYYRSARGDGGYGDRVGTKQASANLSHTHTVQGYTGAAGYGAAWFWPPLGSTPFNFIISAEGGVEGRPANIALMWIIKTKTS
jgi:phage-related tail fiber protein